MTTVICPECRGEVTVWADNSGGVTVNYRCDNPQCDGGKGPWDTPEPEPTPHIAVVAQRGDKWHVIYAGATVGRHAAKYKAQEQADSLNL